VKATFVVQRYGLEVNGGSELHCRLVAEHMAKHWDVEVLTTCAVDYTTWRNEYPSGLTRVNGVPVRRFPVDAPRDMSAFNRLSTKVLRGGAGREAESEWLRAQGPFSPPLLDHLRRHDCESDFFIFFTYLYASTFFGLPLVADRSALVPTAHDEPPIYLEIYHDLFQLPKVLIFNTPEERDFVNRRFSTHNILQDVVGVGVEELPDVSTDRFLDRHGERLEGRDFVLYIGRIDASKGCRQLFSHFVRFREDLAQYPLKLVLIGSTVMEIPEHPDIVHLGFVSEQEKFDAIAASKVVILPSPYESLSIVALEVWQLGKPVLANGVCNVLRGQCIRSNGGLWYENYGEFKEALHLLLVEPGLREQLGASGRVFVRRCYRWDAIEAKYVRLINLALQEAPADRRA
jgi:glycosyltransferase involved in cell wall biosynthesis